MNEKEPLEIKNLTKFYILVLLKSKELISGYYILKRLESDLGKTSSPTYVYDFLKNLKNRGYVKEVIDPKSNRKKGFSITPSGEKFINRIFSRFNNLIEAAIESKLKVCASCGVRLYDNYYTETIEGKEMHFCCKHCAKAYKDNLKSQEL
ncbi:MAG: PadR family transcriptional regulator [Promethearchaeota archaeon]